MGWQERERYGDESACALVGVEVRAFLAKHPFEYVLLAGKCSEGRRDVHIAPALWYDWNSDKQKSHYMFAHYCVF